MAEYSINHVSRMLGITPKTLRYYEDKGLLKPHRGEDSNYRIYSDEDVERLKQILFYRRLEFPLRDIAKLIDTPEVSQRVVQEQIENLQKEAERYNKLAELARKALPGMLSDGSPEFDYCKKSALIIQSMQNDFVTGPIACEHAQAIVKNIKNVAEAARKVSIPVIYVNDMHLPGVDNELSIWGNHALVGTRGIETIDELYPHRQDRIIYKNFYGGFLRTKLHDTLTEIGVTDLIVTGVLTNVGISHTVADGYYRGYRLCVPEDCTAAIHKSECDFALEQMKTNFGIRLTNSEEIIHEITEKKN